MRLWTIHPGYLDAKGLVALWREALLAQAVLNKRTRGYVHHPQLIRFRETPSPEESIAAYLQGVLDEAIRRGYRFDAAKIGFFHGPVSITATRGQIRYEWNHLMTKLRVRSPSWLNQIKSVSRPVPHPLFCIVPGPVERWEGRSRTRLPD